jgi:hypothetical protein
MENAGRPVALPRVQAMQCTWCAPLWDGQRNAVVKELGGIIDQVFVLRFWWEEAGNGSNEHWRAQVRHVNSRQKKIANDVAAAFALIRAQLNDASGDSCALRWQADNDCDS